MTGQFPATVVVTRTEGPDGPLTRLLQAAGHRVLHWQVTAIAEASDPEALRDALNDLNAYDWIVFTSAAAVEAVVREHAAVPTRTRVAAVGPATANALRRNRWPVDVVPTDAGAEHLAAAMLAQHPGGRRVLFPASAIALPTLARQLRNGGLVVDQVEAYRVLDAEPATDAWRAALNARTIDAITFASPSAITALRGALGDEAFAKIDGRIVACIGPTTADSARDNGLTVTAVATRASLESLAAATTAALKTQPTAPATPRKVPS